jgi:hypothetical protein
MFGGQKVVSWFSGGQEFRFLSSPLASSLFSSRNSFEIKYSTIEVVVSGPYFFAYQTHP